MHVDGSNSGERGNPLSRLVRWLTDDHLLGERDPSVGRVFVSCHQCRRYRPMYHIASKRHLRCPSCGSGELVPYRLPAWRAFWAYVICGVVWRKWMLRKREQRFWDPRMPVRLAEPDY